MTKGKGKATDWTAEETKKLYSWIGKYTPLQIIGKYQDYAKKKKWQFRTETAIRVKLKRSNKSVVTLCDNLSMTVLSLKLDISVDRIQLWIDKGLKYEAGGNVSGKLERYSKYAISKKNLQEFAIAHPELMWGIDWRRLGEVISNKQLARKICDAIVQPTCGRQIKLIRLDTGDIYPTAKKMAAAIGVNKASILRIAHSESGVKIGKRAGLDIMQIDYPVYVVPLKIRDEFSYLVGYVFWEIFLELRSIGGENCTKKECQIVGLRNAVDIVLAAFRRSLNIDKDIDDASQPELRKKSIEFYKSFRTGLIQKFLNYSYSEGYRIITNTIIRKSYQYFIFISNPERNYEERSEFANNYIDSRMIQYRLKGFLPHDWYPKSKLELADMFSYIFQSILFRISINEDRSITFLLAKAINYIRDKKLKLLYSQELAEFSDEIRYDDSISEGYDLISQWIETNIQSKKDRELIEMYIALIAEGASKKEAALAMNLDPSQLDSIESMLLPLKELYAS